MSPEASPEPRSNGWTGGQYSLFRALTGALLAGLFACVAAWFSRHGPLPWVAAAAAGILLSSLFVAGWWHRAAAAALVLLMMLFLVSDFASEQRIGPGLVALVLVLALHLAVPPGPFGSWAARGSPDLAAGWRMPRNVHLAGWLVLSLGYLGEGIALLLWEGETYVLDSRVLVPLVAAHWGFGVLCIFRALRPFVWLVMLGVQVFLVFPPVGWEWVVWMLPLHLFVFDPAWIRAGCPGERVITFYDGQCGLCHRAVRFVLAEDRAGTASDFACLGGPTFRRILGEEREEDGLPDSIVVYRQGGGLLVKSSATLCLMRRLGGVWRVVAWVLGLVPRTIRDGCYDFVARRRRRWFPQPDGVCPVVPARMRGRFLDLQTSRD